MPSRRIEEPRQYLPLARDYYVAGRFLFWQHQVVSGNLLHHAIELFLKHDLVQDASDVSEHRHHELNVLWEEFKVAHPGDPLAQWDRVVADLNQWEELRYGGFTPSTDDERRGRSRAMVFHPHHEPADVESDEEHDVYVLCLDDVDQLVAAIVASASVNPDFLLVGVTEDARHWYSHQNGAFPAPGSAI